MSSTLKEKFIASEDVLSQEIQDETVLLDLKSEDYFGMNRVGSRVWQLIGEGKTREDMLEALAAEFEVEKEGLARDLDLFISDLAQAGLVSAADADSEKAKS